MRLLIVCTGNICRSPMGEVVVRHGLASAGLAARVAVASAGTWSGKAGEPADPRAVAAAARRGYDLRGFRARAVELADFAQFDVMFGMTQGHVAELLGLQPRDGSADIRRYLDLTDDIVERDVPDPYAGSVEDFEHALDLIERGAAGIVAHVLHRCAGG